MARTFDGVDDEIRCNVGALSGITGYGSIALVVRRVGSAEPVPIAAYQANTARTAFHFDGGDMYYVTTAGFVSAGFTVDANIWNVAVATKDTGTVAVRFHQYGYDDGIWQRANSSGTVADGSTSASTIRLGGPGAANPYDGDIAVAAWWKDVVLTDAQVETLPHSLQAWLALSPTAMWVLDQSATTQTVIDLTGGGANQSAITGTAVATSSAPIGYGFDPVIPAAAAAAGGNNFTRTVDDTLGLTDAVTVDLTASRTVDDTLGLTDAVALDRTIVITDNLGLTDGGFTTEVGEDITDTLGLTDDVSVDFAGATSRTIDDTLGLTDSLTVESTFARTATDTLGLTDDVAVDFAGAATRTITDALGLTDSVAVEATFARLISDTLGLTDAVSTVGGTVDLEYLAIIVGPLREPLIVAAMAEPLTVAEIDPAEPVTVGAIRDTAPAIGTLRDTGPITGALQEPLTVEPMREPITVDQLRE